MRLLILFLFSLLIIAGCDTKEKVTSLTIEEKVLLEVFSGFSTAQAYDKICNEGKITQQEPNGDNLYWYGNMQILPALVAAPMIRRNPDMPPEEGAQRLLKIQQQIMSKGSEILQKEGCDSEKAKKMEKQLELFRATPPWVIMKIITQKVENEGGTMTQLTNEENKITPQK
jgi:hypothetical protein